MDSPLNTQMDGNVDTYASSQIIYIWIFKLKNTSLIRTIFINYHIIIKYKRIQANKINLTATRNSISVTFNI